MLQKLINTPKQLSLIVLLLCLLGSFLQVMLKEQTKPIFDARGYISVAQNLAKTGVYSNYNKDLTEDPGNFFAPLYPGFLSLFSRSDVQISQAFACYRDKGADCILEDLTPIFIVQSLIAGLTLFFVYYACLAVMNRQDVALLSVLVAGLSGTFSHYAGLLITETLAFFFYMGFFAFYSKAMLRSPTIKNWVIAGGFLAFSILTRPTYIYFFYFLLPFSVLWCRYRMQMSWKYSATVALSISGIVFLILFPWMLRNYGHFGEFFITDGYAAFILVQRLAYNAMSWGEWAVGFVFLLPDFGDGLAEDLFDKSLYIRYTWNDPTSFYRVGNSALRGEMVKLAGGSENLLSYLINNVLIPDLGKHIMVTFVVMLRGMWIGKYIGLVAILCLPYIFILAKKNAQLFNFLSFMLPGAFFLGFHAFVSINMPRYNEPLIAVYAFIVALLLIQIAAKISPRNVEPISVKWP